MRMARILIVEDEVVSRTTVGKVVELLGHIPIFSPDGQHALETLEIDASIEVVITDVVMPRMSGRELVDRIRGMEKIKSVPVIIMSSYVGPKEIADLLEHGATRFQPKPLTREYLKCNIESCLDA